MRPLVIATLYPCGLRRNVSMGINVIVTWQVLVTKGGFILAHCAVMLLVAATNCLRNIVVAPHVLWPFLIGCKKNTKDVDIAIELSRVAMHVLSDVLLSLPPKR